jgi:hypothetical protein
MKSLTNGEGSFVPVPRKYPTKLHKAYAKLESAYNKAIEEKRFLDADRILKRGVSLERRIDKMNIQERHND